MSDYGYKYAPGTYTFVAGRADVAGGCQILVETPPVPSSAQWYGGADVEYDLSAHPKEIPMPQLTGGGVTFKPHELLLTAAKRSASIELVTQHHGNLPAVPPAIILGGGIRPYGEQCATNWHGIKTSENGLAITPTRYSGPRDRFTVKLK
ncbi:MAG: hypothetical protein JO270_00770 [Acidobacteriaceae bacterium]|nr:hypothetical protein [Acidobacteriaceae bacterium]